MQRARFVINEHLSAGLVRGDTVIYVDGKRFDQCKYLLLARVDPCDLGSRAANEASNGGHVIDSIDEAALSLDHSMEPLPENPDVEIEAFPYRPSWRLSIAKTHIHLPEKPSHSWRPRPTLPLFF